ncbi:hypothetical protein [Archangium violaceum]|uniref:Uncharacterized protein n=1 Tax=Archangium violaceum Cb vi76 TaxID=1406225 RepID=A0A084SI04_9BACT|nr:hypothetical protein [Archangium violaceum]KFA88089.1 hypothetical protein Q664_43275 [Archangium violaceum Cb vi76]
MRAESSAKLDLEGPNASLRGRHEQTRPYRQWLLGQAHSSRQASDREDCRHVEADTAEAGDRILDFQPSTPKPDAKPQFTPRPDINGNKLGLQNGPKPMTLDNMRPGLDRPDFNPDRFKPSGLGPKSCAAGAWACWLS